MNTTKKIVIASIVLLLAGIVFTFFNESIVGKIIIVIGAFSTIYNSFNIKKHAIKEVNELKEVNEVLTKQLAPLSTKIDLLNEKIIELNKINSISQKYLKEIQKSSTRDELIHVFIKDICNDLNASKGAFYLMKDKKLELSAGFGVVIDEEPQRFELNEGLIGQVAVDKKTLILKDIPDDYIDIKSGLGASKPKQVVMQPILFNNELLAIIELATFSPLSESEISLLEMISDTLGTKLSSLKN